MVVRDARVADPTAFVDGGRQREGEGLLRRRAGPGAVPGRADPCRRFLDQLRDCRRGYEPPAAQDDAWEIARTQQLVDRVSGDAAEQLPCFFDRIEFATDHGLSIAVQGSVFVARKGPLPVDCHVRAECRSSARESEGAVSPEIRPKLPVCWTLGPKTRGSGHQPGRLQCPPHRDCRAPFRPVRVPHRDHELSRRDAAGKERFTVNYPSQVIMRRQ